jgi:hypothetical protein
LVSEFNLDKGLGLKIKEILVNGRPILDFFCFHDGRFQKSYTANGGGKNEVISRYDWKSDEEVTLEISGAVGKERVSPFLREKVKAPSRGGYWNPAWRFYTTGIVLKETVGVSRVDEPVHVTLGLYGDRVTDPVQELRIVSLDSETGETEEISSQVYAVGRYAWDKPDERYQPTTTCEVAFHADVPANSSRVYLAFYGNNNASAPLYRSGLHIEGEGLGLTAENEFYRITLSEKSGAIDEITMKKGEPFTFKHGLETNGALHWNPGIYAPPRPWLHASDWDPPAHYSVERGPIFTMTKRSGNLEHYPEADVSITYMFYEKVPWVLMSSTIDVKKDIDVKAIRNGEIVLDRKLVDQFAWRDPEGKTGSMNIQEIFAVMEDFHELSGHTHICSGDHGRTMHVPWCTHSFRVDRGVLYRYLREISTMKRWRSFPCSLMTKKKVTSTSTSSTFSLQILSTWILLRTPIQGRRKHGWLRYLLKNSKKWNKVTRTLCGVSKNIQNF